MTSTARSRASCAGAEKGSALLITMNVIIILTAMGAAFLTVATADHREHRAAVDQMKSFYIAEAGLSHAIAELRSGRSGSLGSMSAPLVFDDGGYWTVAVETSGSHVIRAYGLHGDERQALEAVVGADASGSFFDAAGFGEVESELEDEAMSDSYDSAQGSYLSQANNTLGNKTYAGTEGNVESNGDVVVSKKSAVFGDALSGVRGLVSMALGGTIVGGTTNRSDDEVLFPVIVPTDILSMAPIEMDLAGSDARTLASGDWHLSELRMKQRSTLSIIGPATVVVDEELMMTDDAQLSIDGVQGPVLMYVRGKVDIVKNSVLSSTRELPSDFMLLTDLDNWSGFEDKASGDGSRPIRLRDNADVYGVIYAPNGVVRMEDDAELFGSVYAKKLRLKKKSMIHYDTALRRLPISDVGSGKAVAWAALGGLQGLHILSWRRIGFDVK